MVPLPSESFIYQLVAAQCSENTEHYVNPELLESWSESEISIPWDIVISEFTTE